MESEEKNKLLAWANREIQRLIESAQKGNLVVLNRLESGLLLALTTGDDGRVPEFARHAVCMAVHDFLLPDMPLVPKELDEGAGRRLMQVVDLALRINQERVVETIQRWYGRLLDEMTHPPVDPALN